MTDTGVIIGSAGVGLLLVAFLLNLSGRLDEQDRLYLLMNLLGSLLAAWYAWTGNNVPFIVLELAWALAAAGRLVAPKKRAVT